MQGTFGGCGFEALVFPTSATNPAFEIRPGCRISKLEVRKSGDIIANFDRGWDVMPTDGGAWDCVAFLVLWLAEAVYGPDKPTS